MFTLSLQAGAPPLVSSESSFCICSQKLSVSQALKPSWAAQGTISVPSAFSRARVGVLRVPLEEETFFGRKQTSL